MAKFQPRANLRKRLFVRTFFILISITYVGISSGTTGGSIVAWGSNSDGKCDVPLPNRGFVGVAAGMFHSLGLKSDGSIIAWGYNGDGQCNIPIPNSDFVMVAAGIGHSLGLRANGSIAGWGDNGHDQCRVPLPNSGFVAIAAGDYHNLGLKADGSIRAWGDNYSGQRTIPSPNSGFVAISAGSYHCLALKADGSIVAWGHNRYGQCNVPIPNSGFVGISAGSYHSLGLKADGTIRAWGDNSAGQCNVPSPNSGFIGVAAGSIFSFGLKSNGSIVVWGSGSTGQCNVPSPNKGYVAVEGGIYHVLSLKGSGAFELVALEAIQTIQDWENSIPMIEGKTTYVRAHIQTNDPSCKTVSAMLRGYRDGKELSGSPLKAINKGGVIPVGPNAADGRGTFENSLNFNLPESWLTGSVKLQLVSPSGQIDFKEPAETNGGVAGDGAITVTFEDGGDLEVRFVRLSGPNGEDIPETVGDGGILDLVDRLTTIYPIKNVTYSVVRLPWPYDRTISPQRVNARIVWMRVNDGCLSGCRRYYYSPIVGIVDPGGAANDVPGTVASGEFIDSDDLEIQPHELGHLLGLHHPVHTDLTPLYWWKIKKLGACGEDAPPWAPNFDNFFEINGQTRPTIGPMDKGVNRLIYGYDAFLRSVIKPHDNFELMGYCRPRWISDKSYKNIHQALSSIPPIPPGEDSPDTYVIVHGEVDFAADTVELLPFGKVTTTSQPEIPETGDYILELRDSAQQVLASIPFEPQRSVGSEGGMMDTGSFLLVLPDDPAVRHWVVLHGDKTLATASASNSAPVVSLLSPNGGEVISGPSVTVSWTASDLDGDELTYTILYSADAGVNWRCLAVDLSGEITCVIPRNSLIGSEQGLFKVIASDGVLTDSDVSDAVITVGDNLPTIRILAPANGSVATFDQQIAFEASGYDVEDGSLPGSQIRWSSNLNGVLGTGTLLLREADEFSEGLHTITARATDSKGQQANAEVQLRISRIPGDISRDGKVDLTDLTQFVQEWQKKGCSSFNNNCGFCDIDGNSSVDLREFQVIASDWMKGI